MVQSGLIQAKETWERRAASPASHQGVADENLP
jgi:hypothetical protein